MEKLDAHQRLAKFSPEMFEATHLLMSAMRSDWVNKFDHIPATKKVCDEINAKFPDLKRWEQGAIASTAREIEKGTR